MRPEDIHGKKLIAVAGKDVFGKKFINIVNKEIASKNLMTIGININEEDFDFFISNLPDSKVEVTVFMPEYQKKAAIYFGQEGFLLVSYKKDGKLEFIISENEESIDDAKLFELVNNTEFL